jgi:ABC-type nitrate/sulfonate/bicarbonate transport system permease component
MKLAIRSFGISCSVLAFCISLIIGVWYSVSGFSSHLIDLISSFYANIFKFSFNPLLPILKNIQNNILPISILSVFSLIDGFFIGAIFAFIYNLTLTRDKK